MMSPSALELMMSDARLSADETATDAMVRRIIGSVIIGLEEAGCPVTFEQANVLLEVVGVAA